ncbi:amino acid ABC transporter permease [Bifidobacterium scaligerum]|uniref:Amino acid ABC transporter permease n=1 Tax=Bifidobacterium scaligerum TaxID=2052656 RepID=A0A2M9HPM2_9BIFI|nr:amino acid ABC transporter permease [Bifidobacterium scaligerum]PJM78762.1 amino acid ABC transporter permease [Bifidobacterium scaligerum]
MSTTIFDFNFFLGVFPKVMPYFPITVLIVVVAFVGGVLLGFICALIKLTRIPVLVQLGDLYVSFIRGTPLLVQLYLIYFGIPIGIRLWNANFGTDFSVQGIPALLSVLIAYSLNEGAYQRETIRGAIESVDPGPVEAARSFGLTEWQVMRRVILPDALRIAIPNLGNSLLKLLKNTSLAFTVSVMDIMAQGKIIGSQGYRYFEVYIALAVIYWVSCTLLSWVINAVERWLNRYRREAAE